MQILQNEQKATLLLADGTVFEGLSFGAQGTTIGEVVFTTGMTGYQEALTDPSYCGQIVTQTFPLVGNYGVNEEDQESDRSYVKGYVVREWCECPSNFRCEGTIDAFLKKHDIIGLYDIDTRALTRKIREHGVMNGMITTEEITDREAALERIGAFAIRDAVRTVTAVQPKKYTCENPQYEVALIDYGYKRNIRRSLLLRGCNVTVLPATVAADQLREGGFDGIMLSNGPGDPSENTEAIENLREIARLGIPIFGICLGHQLMALAHGCRTGKLKYGHRGENQPVKNRETGRVYISSQNHGYAVVSESLDPQWGKELYVNVNDGTCEGVRYSYMPAFTVQFHPEACGGPLDTRMLFDEFFAMMG